MNYENELQESIRYLNSDAAIKSPGFNSQMQL